jgi:predicted tellurium resistance membrane protein TerC
MEILLNPEAWIALATLTALEIVLGIDNIIFITILVGRLPEAQRQRARIFGLALAMMTRILLLLSLTWVMGLTRPLLTLSGFEISGRDVILLGGGLFLLVKSTLEIHGSLEGTDDTALEATGSGRHVDTDRPYRHYLLARFGNYGGWPGA